MPSFERATKGIAEGPDHSSPLSPYLLLLAQFQSLAEKYKLVSGGRQIKSPRDILRLSSIHNPTNLERQLLEKLIEIINLKGLSSRRKINSPDLSFILKETSILEAVTYDISHAKTVPFKVEEFAFVLMPFGNLRLDQIYLHHIKKPIEKKLDLRVYRADDNLKSSPILEHILERIKTSIVVIADLTFGNRNVSHEIGISQGLGRPIVLLSQNIKDVPSNLRSRNIHIYQDNLRGLDRLSKKMPEYVLDEL